MYPLPWQLHASVIAGCPGLGSTKAISLVLRPRLELFASSVIFGLFAVLTRWATLLGFASGQVAIVRFGFGAMVTLAYFALRPKQLVNSRRRLLVARGLLGGIAVVCYFAALARIPTGEATLLNNLYPVLTTLIAVFALGERPSPRLVAALGMTTIGVLLVLGTAELRLSLGIGELAGFASAVLGAGAVIAVRAARVPAGRSPPANAATVFFALSLGGLAVSGPLALGAWTSDVAAWGLALAAALLGLVAQLLMTDALGYLSIPEASVWQQLAPVASYLWALLLLDEHVTFGTTLGVAIAVAGVAYGAALGKKAGAPRRRAVPAQTPSIAARAGPETREKL
jgi:drug/metabolite transporter (DMT)-like permease